jgi:hypothetical protein
MTERQPDDVDCRAVLRRRFVSLAVFVVACASASCAAVLGFERLSEDGAADAGADGATDGPPSDGGVDAPTGPCAELGVPAPPVDAGPGVAPPLLGALRLLDFGIDVDGGRPQIPGFNLDLTCSVDVASSSCATTLLPTTFEAHAKDKTATGVDNAGFSLIEYISRFSNLLTAQTINDGIKDGKYGAVIRLDGWNGQPDDDDVQVDFFPAIGFKARADGGTKPAFDDGDEWILDSRFQVGGVLEASTIKSDRAWIAGGRLVGRFKEVSLPIVIDVDPKPFDIHITDAIISATVGTDESGKPALRQGVVAGRWKTSDFLGQVRTIYVKNSNGLKNTVLCEAVPGAQLIYKSVKSQICDGRDIRSDSADNKNLPCDAISAGLTIETYSVQQLGSFAAGADGGVRCVDEAVPVGDDCPP